MVNWMQAWWQVRQSWSFVHHAYRCGYSLHADVTDAWSHRRHAMAYTVATVATIAEVKPRLSMNPTGF